MARFNFVKDADARLDWLFDWSDWLASSEVITDSEIICEDGLTVVSTSNSSTSVLVWLSGGTPGESYKLTNRITTNQQRIDDRSISVRIVER